MVQNQATFWVLPSTAFETVMSYREEKQKKHDFGQSFSFSNLSTFGNLEVDFRVRFSFSKMICEFSKQK